MWAIVDEDAVVKATGNSPNSSAVPLPVGEQPDFDRLARFASEVHVEVMAGQTIVWWEYRHQVIPRSTSGDARTILSDLLGDYLPDADDRRVAQQRIAGIAGSAKNSASDPRDPSEIHALLRRAFTKRREFLPPEVLDDPRFREWLNARAYELASPSP